MPAPVAETFGSPGISLVHERTVRVIDGLCFAVGLACVAVAAFPPLSALARGLAVAWTVAPPLALLAASVFLRRTRLGAGELRVSGEAVTAASAGSRRSFTFERGAVKAGIIVPYVDHHEVELDLGDGRVVVAETEGFDEGERLLTALGVDAARRRSRVDLAQVQGWGERAMLLFLTIATLLTAMTHGGTDAQFFAPVFALILGLPSAAFWLATWRSAGSVTVGLDGVEIRRGRRSRFIPFDEIASVRHVLGAIEIVRRSGRVERIALRSRFPTERSRALTHRIQETLLAREGLRETATRADVLERRDRPIEIWRAALREIVRPADAYRSSALSVDDVSAALADPDAPAEHRVGAALALSASDDPEVRGRLRIAADTCASPRLRVALAGIADADPDDAAIEAALSEEAGSADRRRSATEPAHE